MNSATGAEMPQLALYGRNMREILHFSAEWCGPCKMMVPIIGKYLESNPGVKYTKIDIDENP